MNTPPPVPDLRAHRHVVVVTGAGISAASGVPTYRQAGSGWTDPDLERKSHANRYGNHLGELWGFWGQLRTLTAASAPNAAHLALARAADRCAARGGSLTIATQNVDGLHARAGGGEVLELHGSIARSRCLRRGCGPAFEDATVPPAGQVPACARCGRPTRPDVVLFGERLAPGMLKEVDCRLRRADLCLYVGTSGNVWPAADFVMTAARAGARCVLVNADPWDHPHQDFHETILGRAEELLPRMLI